MLIIPSATSEQVNRLYSRLFKSYWSCSNIVYKNLFTFGNSQGEDRGKGMIAVREQKATEKNAVSWLGRHLK